jgi:cbb3-type cytochrome oxidase maturation protein
VTILLFLIPLATLLAGLALAAFLWSVRDGQMDDLETPALRILHDDKAQPRSRH